MVRNTAFWVFALLFLSGCSTRYENHLFGGLFALTVPDYLTSMNSLNDDAQVQLGSRNKDVFAIVRYNTWEELKSRNRSGVAGTLEDYYDFHIENLLMEITEPKAPGPKETKINGLDALVGYLSGNIKGEHIHYKIVMIGGKDYLYQMLVWTTSENLPEYEADMDKLIRSFREM
ncbi:MAG: hypothetical protein R3C61_27055 [Bacteroidia bacterium]